MPFDIDYIAPIGSAVTFDLRRNSDRLPFDFNGTAPAGVVLDVTLGVFGPTPVAPTAALADPGGTGKFSVHAVGTGTQFPDGRYIATIYVDGVARDLAQIDMFQGSDDPPSLIPTAFGVVTGSPSGVQIDLVMVGLGASVVGPDLNGRRLYYRSRTRQGIMTAGCTTCTNTGSTFSFHFTSAQPAPAVDDVVVLAGY